MSSREAVRRLQAYRDGKPLPRGETQRVHIVDDANLLIMAFVRMGGESRPWGIAFGTLGKTPKFLTVPEARNRDLVAEMVVEIGSNLLRNLRQAEHTGTELETWQDLAPLKQIWLPNSTHLDMLHHLAFAYCWTKYGGKNRKTLNAIGRACGWLFREAHRPGQTRVVVATEALKEAYTFPTENTRQGHLGFLMSWLTSKGDYDKRLAKAIEVERQSIATSLDPVIERDELSPLVTEWGEGKSEFRKSRAASKIRQILKRELKKRWELTEQAVIVLRDDVRRENTGLAKLVDESLKEQWYQYNRLELRLNSDEDGPAFFPSVETDRHPAAAAARYQVHQASAELVDGLLVHDDSELLAEAISDGDAFQGEILEVSDVGTNRSTRPIWFVEDPAERQLRLRVGSRVACVGYKKRQGVVVGIYELEGGGIGIEVEITINKTNKNIGPGIHRLPPTDDELVGMTAAFVSAPADGISRKKSFQMWKNDGPGAWLTHMRPGGVGSQTQEGDRDDVTAVTEALGDD